MIDRSVTLNLKFGWPESKNSTNMMGKEVSGKKGIFRFSWVYLGAMVAGGYRGTDKL